MTAGHFVVFLNFLLPFYFRSINTEYYTNNNELIYNSHNQLKIFESHFLSTEH